MGALLDGLYDGDVTIAAILLHGDFRLGTFTPRRRDGHPRRRLLPPASRRQRHRGHTDAGNAHPSPRSPHFRTDHTLAFTPSTPTAVRRRSRCIDSLLGSETLTPVSGRFSEMNTRILWLRRRPIHP